VVNAPSCSISGRKPMQSEAGRRMSRIRQRSRLDSGHRLRRGHAWEKEGWTPRQPLAATLSVPFPLDLAGDASPTNSLNVILSAESASLSLSLS
jgi:hypothetical protein